MVQVKMTIRRVFNSKIDRLKDEEKNCLYFTFR